MHFPKNWAVCRLAPLAWTPVLMEERRCMRSCWWEGDLVMESVCRDRSWQAVMEREGCSTEHLPATPFAAWSPWHPGFRDECVLAGIPSEALPRPASISGIPSIRLPARYAPAMAKTDAQKINLCALHLSVLRWTVECNALLWLHKGVRSLCVHRERRSKKATLWRSWRRGLLTPGWSLWLPTMSSGISHFVLRVEGCEGLLGTPSTR